eukprot:m.256162 g.256162  ORF g.256162 m.256162 type:complete len:297 (-) comp34131_c0_seq1:178-1068(-)
MKSSSQTEADKVLLAKYPRDFVTIPQSTAYGEGADAELNKASEDARIEYLKNQLVGCLKEAVERKERPIFTIALIAGDVVILDAIHKAGLIEKISIVFVDTYTLFPETMSFLRQVEDHYQFKAHVYHAKGIESQAEYEQKYGTDFWRKDIDEYDRLCKVEPLNRALAEHSSDCWINGRRRDHGADRATLAVWEGKKLNPLAFWSFEDCWTYLRKFNVPYHPLHDVGYSSLGDAHSTDKVPLGKWMTYAGERSGRFVGLKNADGSVKTECGIHNRPAKKARKAEETPNATVITASSN